MNIETRAPRAVPARSGASTPAIAARPTSGLSPAEIRKIVLDILG